MEHWVLQTLSERGWEHLLLSNHVPELRDVLKVLGLDQHLSAVFNSAETGYEKPHPQAFRAVLEYTGYKDPLWMIGDNYAVDILDAERMGIPNGILVRKPHPAAPIFCADLWQVLGILEDNV
jgi:putative hydrolase of the HAD superfamily